MKYPQIITSLLDQDLYKYSMGQAIYHQFPEYKTTWTFKCRNEGIHFTSEMIEEIKAQIAAYCELHYTKEELDYLRSIKWIKGNYVDYLKIWHPQLEDFEISNKADCGLTIETKGTWLNTSMYEVPVLAIVNEVYYHEVAGDNYSNLLINFTDRLNAKIQSLENKEFYIPTFSEFGTRRRLSRTAQHLLINHLTCYQNSGKVITSKFIGTSNVMFAKEFGITPMGTMAHEWIMGVGQGNHKLNPAHSNWFALEAWVKEYGVLNGIALTDTITTDCFLKDFQLTYATLFSGVRHDSGNPIEWGEKMIKHYESLGINPKSKTLLFSDSLNFEKASEIFYHFRDRANVAFGIGTYLSNDTYMEPLNIVMKITKCNGQDVAKISDTTGKGMCKNPEYVDYLQRAIDWRIKYE